MILQKAWGWIHGQPSRKLLQTEIAMSVCWGGTGNVVEYGKGPYHSGEGDVIEKQSAYKFLMERRPRSSQRHARLSEAAWNGNIVGGDVKIQVLSWVFLKRDSSCDSLHSNYAIFLLKEKT